LVHHGRNELERRFARKPTCFGEGNEFGENVAVSELEPCGFEERSCLFVKRFVPVMQT
jgi:hypothetical protein